MASIRQDMARSALRAFAAFLLRWADRLDRPPLSLGPSSRVRPEEELLYERRHQLFVRYY